MSRRSRRPTRADYVRDQKKEGMTKTEQLLRTLKENKSLERILERAETFGTPNWYLGGGCIAQTVWNIQHGFDPENAIKDYDLVYYDSRDTSYEAEDVFIQKGKEIFKDIPVPVEIRNQARVHLWYGKRFGGLNKPYRSVEESIDTWTTTATAVAMRKNGGHVNVYAPFGLDDLMNMVVRPNKIKIAKEIYQEKMARWKKVWPHLTVVPWEEE